MTTDNALNTGNLETASSFVLSRNPDRAMQEMMETIDTLRAIYVEENDALLAADTSRFLSLQQKKLEAARDYKAGAEQIMQRKAEFKNANPALRRKFETKYNEFSRLSTVNLDALARMRRVVQRLGDRIMSAAREAAQKDTPNYGATGNLNKNERRVSLGLNESA